MVAHHSGKFRYLPIFGTSSKYSSGRVSLLMRCCLVVLSLLFQDEKIIIWEASSASRGESLLEHAGACWRHDGAAVWYIVHLHTSMMCEWFIHHTIPQHASWSLLSRLWKTQHDTSYLNLEGISNVIWYESGGNQWLHGDTEHLTFHSSPEFTTKSVVRYLKLGKHCSTYDDSCRLRQSKRAKNVQGWTLLCHVTVIRKMRLQRIN